MEWLNDGVGLIVVISSVIIVVLLVVVISLLFVLRSKIAVQRLKFLGFYSTDHKTRERFADCTIGNGSLNEIALSEIGVSNGKVSYNLTDLYKRKANLGQEARIVIEQRSSLRFSLTADELMTLVTEGKHGKELNTLRLYAVDLTGNLYRGQIRSVRKLVAELLAEEEARAEGKAPAMKARGKIQAPAEEPAAIAEERAPETAPEESAKEEAVSEEE